MKIGTGGFRRLQLVLLLLGVLNFAFWTSCDKESRGLTPEKDHPLAGVIPGFSLASYYAGGAFMAAEFVNAGCKNLALSAPYTDEELAAVLEPTRLAAEKYHVSLYVEKDLLITRLFPETVAAGKTVILMARNKAILDDYFALKEDRVRAVAEGRLAEAEEEIAWRFGKLLSYGDEKIAELLAQQANR
jgi:hypothetical protein